MRPTPGPAPAAGRRRVPLAVWIILGVLALHLLAFLAVANVHYLPKARYVPPPPTPNFGARQTRTVDPQTGEVTTESDFSVSTTLATPPPPRATPRPASPRP